MTEEWASADQGLIASGKLLHFLHQFLEGLCLLCSMAQQVIRHSKVTSGPQQSTVRLLPASLVAHLARASATSPTCTGWNFVYPPPTRGKKGSGKLANLHSTISSNLDTGVLLIVSV